MKEIWLDIPGFEFYQASNLGRLRSKERIGHRVSGSQYTVKSKILSPAKDKGGYLRTMISDGSKYKTVKVHRLVCLTFNPIEGIHLLEVNHINGVKDDNRVENLEWCTKVENIRHSFETGLQNNFIVASKQACKKQRKLSQGDFNKAMSDREAGKPYYIIAKEFGMSKKTVMSMVKGLTYRDFHEERKAERSNRTDSPG